MEEEQIAPQTAWDTFRLLYGYLIPAFSDIFYSRFHNGSELPDCFGVRSIGSNLFFDFRSIGDCEKEANTKSKKITYRFFFCDICGFRDTYYVIGNLTPVIFFSCMSPDISLK